VSSRPPSCVLGVAVDCSGASCLGSGSCLSSGAVYSTLGASGGTCSDAHCSTAVSTIVSSFRSALGATCSLVTLAPSVVGFPPAVNSSGTSVDAELQFNKSTVDIAFYYLPLLCLLKCAVTYMSV
jgi:hypothetical protein